MPQRLERSSTNRVWTGVCGGIGDYFQVDPTLVRALFVVAAILTGGLWFLVYIALVILMPLPGRPALGEQAAGDRSAAAGDEPSIGERIGEATDRLSEAAGLGGTTLESTRRRREAIGFMLIALGAVFLLANVGVFRMIEWRYVWPLALIAIGAFILVERARR